MNDSRREPPASANGQPTQHHVALPAAEPAGVLVVDDSPANLQSVAALVEGMGLEVTTAASGREALRKLLERDFALVLLDVNMPTMDGFDTAALIHGRPRSAHTPIIFITAEARTDDARVRGYTAGAVDYIYAPIVPAILRAKVQVFANLFRLNRQLEVANKELESFSHAVAHDLKAPLRAISGFATVLNERAKGRLDDEDRRLLSLVRERTKNMGQLIDDWLSFSRLRNAPLTAARIDMTAAAQEVFGELAASERQKARLVLGELPPAWGDGPLIRQVWANLIGNAVKYSSRTPQPVIEVSGRAGPTENTYSVCDNGAGFDMRHYDKLFGMFQRLHAANEFPGTGVGLANVQRIVLRHGGRIWAEGRVHEGATFHFSLPSAASSEPDIGVSHGPPLSVDLFA